MSKNKAYEKSIIREILTSKARFASILVIILLGVAFYAGIKSSGPDMNKTINKLYNTYNLMDSKIVSSLGLSDKDIDLLKNNDNILDFYPTHSIDANLSNINSVVKFMGYDDNNNINDFIVVDGRLPKNSGEIALDEKVLKLNKELKIGDNYVVESDEDTMKSFNKKSFKIVGFVKSPMYIEKESRGTTSVGKGTVDYFAVLNKKDISMDVYTEIYVRFKNVQGLEAYSDKYKEKMEENNNYLKTLYSDREVERVEEIKSEAQEELDKAYLEIEENESKLLDAETEINDAKEKLKEGKLQYEQGLKEYEKIIKDGQSNILEGKKELEKGQVELDKQKENILDGKSKLDEAKKALDKAKQTLINQGIDPNQNTGELKSNIENLNALLNTYNLLSKDIKDTINKINDKEEIPIEKINYWKIIISNKSLGLGYLTEYINDLEKSPGNKDLAINIADGVEKTSSTVKDNISNLETLLNGITKYQQGLSQYNEQVKVLENGEKQLEEAQKQLDNAKLEITQGEKEIEAGKVEGKKELEKAKLELTSVEQSIKEAEVEIAENKQKLLDAKEEMKENQDEINDMKECKYYFFDRNDNIGYSGLKDSIDSLDSIASVLPVFFFLIAILICLTTMTRMVEENRGEIGILKALGYNEFEISKKFVVYASIASILGSVIGILIGCNILPNIISEAYGSLYSLPKLNIYYYSEFIIQSIALSLLCTVGASLFVLRVELKSNPANLMRTKAPKLGKKILLERITFTWKRLNFNQKVTFRNIFRYKQRMVMTVFGIAGCMALLVTGFGLKDSNNGALEMQFNKIWKYDSMVIFDGESNSDNKEYIKILNEIDGYESNLNIHQESVTFSKENMNKQTATMYVVENTNKLNDYILLNDRKTGEVYNISDNGVIINEQLANHLGVSVGDKVTMKDEDNNTYDIVIDNICENYFMHFIYMSPEYYKEIFGKELEYNSQFLNFDTDKANNENISEKLMENDNVINVTSMSDMKKSSEESSANLDMIMLVIIISSGCLAFVVLYNLNNINVSERIRELSTIKVLGFYDNEVTMYILRENIILTLLGIFVGGFLGKILHSFVLKTSEIDTMMFYLEISKNSYIFSALITMTFSMIVMLMMHMKLRKVDMIDALKSNE